MTAVSDTIDRSLRITPSEVVHTAWIGIDLCVLGNRSRMSPEAVEKKYRRLLCLGDDAPWPPINGAWENDRFVVHDGRHEFIASLMLGRSRVFVAWVEQH